ncbi:hypothetical protein NHX12_011400, partial [Muraenolepis orangiensis]
MVCSQEDPSTGKSKNGYGFQEMEEVRAHRDLDDFLAQASVVLDEKAATLDDVLQRMLSHLAEEGGERYDVDAVMDSLFTDASGKEANGDIERTIQVENYSFDLSTGIFTVKDIKRTDDAEYYIEIHHDNGRLIAVGICSLSVQAPVSSPLLSLECLASGEQRVSCSAEGDALRYGWSLDGNRTASHMTLKLGLSGVIKCSVSNDVSNATASTTVSVCVAPVSSPLLSLECLASGEQRVSCSAEGDALRYGWSLDGNRTASHMTLKLGLSGVIKCSVSNDCLASGEQRVSCSAEGDALRYGWSLDGNRTASHMTLKLGLSGVIKCSVSNDVSNATASTTV